MKKKKFFARRWCWKNMFAPGRIIIFLSGMWLFCWEKCGPRPKLFLRLDVFSTLVDHIILTYLGKSFIPENRINDANDDIWIRP